MNTTKLRQKIWQDPIYFLAFGFGSGLMPMVPGTWGTLAAIPLYCLLVKFSWPIYSIFVLIAFLAGIWFCQRVSKDIGEHDYGGIVWDEIVGYLLTMLSAPLGIAWIITGFVLFRVFDIWKPQPIRFLDQRIQGGLGIMLDDVAAAIPAWLILQLLAWSFAK